MTIESMLNGTEQVICLAGELDTLSYHQLESELNEKIPGVEKLVLDLTELEYLSSVGLRVIFSAHKAMSRQGTMIVRNINQAVRDVFEMTGFADILTIE